MSALTSFPQFFFFAAINVISATLAFFLPETNGRSLESMDVLFGLVTKEQREADIARVVAGDKMSENGDDEKEVYGAHPVHNETK